ncbi:MAG TPA: hypothetical protein VFB67_11885 [Candidatus Polarisedimenticolaceae bacterium]|nr:hypothetical protein [Candidatus Polarisedimenticolaceae bacterium]
MLTACALLAAGLLAPAQTDAGGVPPLPSTEAVWSAVEIPGFVVIGPQDERSLREVARRLATLRLILGKLGSGLDTGGERPIPVFVFPRAEAFAPYAPAGGGTKELGGYFAMAYGYRGIAIDFSAPDGYGAVYHELVHHVVRRNFGDVPTWFDEGIAGVYESFECGPASATIGRMPRSRLAWFQSHPLMPMRALAAVTTKSTEYNESERAGTFYTQSLLAVHDLYFGRSPRGPQLARYLEAVHQGASPESALEVFDGGANGLGGEIEAYLKAGQFSFVKLTFEQLKVPEAGPARRLSRAELLEALGMLAVLASPSAPDFAAAHFRASLALEPGRPRALAGSAIVAYARERHAEARAAAESAIAAGCDDPGPFLVGASAIMRIEESRYEGMIDLDKPPSADVLTARGWLQRAVAIEPFDTEALIAFGQTYLFGGGDPSPGIAAFERADALDRLDEAGLTGLLELRVRQRDRARATALVETRLRPIASPDVLARATEALLRLDLEDASDAIRAKDYKKAAAILRGIRAKTSRADLAARLDEQIPRLEAAASAKR